jgi:hypothetical protein
MTGFSAVAEYGVAEAPDDDIVVSFSCAGASFVVSGCAVGLTLQIDSLAGPGEGAVAEFAVAESPPSEGTTLNAAGAVFALSAFGTGAVQSAPAVGASFVLVGQGAGLAAQSQPASFVLTGQAAIFQTNVLSASATFLWSGQAVGIAVAHPGATFALSGLALGFGTRNTMAGASFVLSGLDVVSNIDLGATLSGGEGAVAEYAVTEFPPFVSFAVFGAVANFNLTAAPLAFRPALLSASASFTLTTGGAGITFANPPAAFALTGRPLGLSTALASLSASFMLSGGAAGFTLRNDAAPFALMGQPLAYSTRILAQAGSFALSSVDIFVGVRAQPASFVLTGMDARFGDRFTAAPASFAFTGQAVQLLNIFKMYPDPAIFTLTGQVAGRSYILGGARAQFALSGFSAFASAFRVAPASFVVTSGQSAAALAFGLAAGQFTLLGWNVVDALGPTGDHIFLVEVQAHDGVEVRTFYLSTAGFTSLPSDEPANTFYDPRIFDPGNFERNLPVPGTLNGSSNVGAGDIVVLNAPVNDGETLDDWFSYGWSGRQVTIKALPVGSRSISAASTLFVGRLDKLTATQPLERFSLQMADRLSDLDKPLLTTLFAGTTVAAAATAEGNADLKGRIKQVCYGSVREVGLQPANPYDLIYLASDGVVQSITVYDGGVALTGDGDNADIAALRAATIAAGHYRTCKALGLVRLGGTPTFTLTADVVEGASSAARSAAQIARRMLLDFGIPSNEIITGSFDELDDANDAICGYVIDDDRTALTAIRDVLASISGWIVPNRDGSLGVGLWREPTAGINFDVEEESLGNSLQRVDGEPPVWRVTLRYARVNTVQAAGSLAGSVSAERQAYLGTEWRQVVAEDASIKIKHLNAREITVDTYLQDGVDAQAEADRLLALNKIEREIYELTLPLSSGWTGDVGLAMTITHPRLGFAAGKSFNIFGRLDKYQDEAVQFSLWG